MAAAPQAPGRGSVRKTRSLTVKTSLNNPYTTSWSPLEREDTHFILQTLEDRFKSIGLKKIEDKRNKKSFLNKQGREKRSLDVDMSEDLEGKTEGNKVPGWTSNYIRRQLAIGVNEVTRALERDELLLVLVCKSVRPAVITSHLIQLSVSRMVPACQISGLSERIAPVLGLRCIMALGIKKDTTYFADEVKSIIPRVPSLNVPWLQGRLEDSTENSESASLENQERDNLDTSFEDLSKHNKKPTEGQQEVVLQPLKIKKLIPNPNKKRKPPRSKKTTSK